MAAQLFPTYKYWLMKTLPLLLFLTLLGDLACGQLPSAEKPTLDILNQMPPGREEAIFASGCFWCSEYIFESLEGVDEVISGYTGGKEKNPTYRQVSAGLTGHAEAILVIYDPKKIDYPTLLELFFSSHDPTQVDGQGPDKGRHYRSAIFYKNEQEKQWALSTKDRLDKSGKYPKPIATEVSPALNFWKAEEYHQDYIQYNPGNPYVRNVSLPKYQKFTREHKDKLKKKD
jgi:peptide-methionine (S)-S-oxide reductase